MNLKLWETILHLIKPFRDRFLMLMIAPPIRDLSCSNNGSISGARMEWYSYRACYSRLYRLLWNSKWIEAFIYYEGSIIEGKFYRAFLDCLDVRHSSQHTPTPLVKQALAWHADTITYDITSRHDTTLYAKSPSLFHWFLAIHTFSAFYRTYVNCGHVYRSYVSR